MSTLLHEPGAAIPIPPLTLERGGTITGGRIAWES
jgi:hypothetical protein